MNDREIWFRKVLWSYFPVSTKGWAFTVGLVVGGLALIFATQEALSLIGRSDLADYAGFVLVPVIIFGWVISERHCE